MKQLTKVFRKSGKAERKGSLMETKAPFWLILSLLVVIVNSCNKENIHPPDLLGYWSCIESSEIQGSHGYNVFIDQYGSELDKIIIDNFYNQGYGNKVIAVLQNGKLLIEEQTVNGLTYSGSGEVLSRKKINLDYTVVSDTLQDHLTAKYEHQ